MKLRRVSLPSILVALPLLAACGQRSDIEPLASQALPPAPYGGEAAQSAEELLELETLAAPERSVELRRRSEERADDPFDLPPQ